VAMHHLASEQHALKHDYDSERIAVAA